MARRRRLPAHRQGRAPGRRAKAGEERRPSRQPRLLTRRFGGALQALAESRIHALRTLPGRDQAGGGGDRRLLFGVSPAQPQTATPQKVGHYLVDSDFRLVHVVSSLTLAAARRARSCITLTAPTVEFISVATSLSEYPCRKRSSSTRR